jgi:hypothetical protein
LWLALAERGYPYSFQFIASVWQQAALSLLLQDAVRVIDVEERGA